MSFKGFQKSVIRAPQTLKAKFNVGEHTKDAVYIDAERRFKELETETKKLHDESKKYFEAINGMLNHQIEFSQAIAEIYKPISGRVSDPDSLVMDSNPEGIKACEEYEAIVRDLLATLQPELEMIETRVIRPADELLEIIKQIRKGATKRDHKQLDYDRHRATLKKLQDKKEKSLKDEKALYKAEADVEQATQEYNYYNDLLKDELPKLFTLEREFIRPLFQSFYYMQLNVFYTLHEKTQGMDIGYFNLNLDIEEAFEAKRGDIQAQAEALTITKFKTTGARRPPGSKWTPPGKLALENKPNRLAIESGKSTYTPPGEKSADIEHPPPPYSSQLSPNLGDNSVGRSSSTGVWGAAAKAKGAAPPPPKPKPSRLSGAPAAETATALYDYEAQAEGDLSFTTGDTIEIVTRGATENEWWVGKIKGKQGQFPGNYVKLN
ncbi:reduced viability upon starvation protein-like protein [Coleophoma cylindrospora]|uniref:Reduced viability upon starvation protein-like protein n=1 Tax=Coleophoma cylindrospora TaxID=1849047 RepID=A0A3D8S6R5_9HELO|nr:reduced viability upon starvation protein-like protein [Coleophoma cylindrospora]